MIPFNRASVVGREIENVIEAIAAGHISGDGPFSRLCHGFFEREFGAKKALLTTSCTHALEMAALLLEIRPGDEVVVPSFTFVSTVNAFVLRGAVPVFVDIRSDTLNLDERLLEERISARTRAIVPVHYAGIGCEMDAILETAGRHGIAVVEDNAHGLFASYRGRSLGTFGCLATLSFHETKNVTCGEGGALLINDAELLQRAEIIREKGTNRTLFFRGQVDRYTWVDIGSSYLPSELLAAFLWGQLAEYRAIQLNRARIWNRYHERLPAFAKRHGASLPFVPPYCQQPYHLYYVRMPSLESRDRFIAHMKKHGVMAVFHYLPLHASPMGKRFRARPNDCPVTQHVSDRLVRLPLYASMSEAEQEAVFEAMETFR